MRKGRFNLLATEYYIVGDSLHDFDEVVEKCVPWCEAQGLRFNRYEVSPKNKDVSFRVVFDVPWNIKRLVNGNFDSFI